MLPRLLALLFWAQAAWAAPYTVDHDGFRDQEGRRILLRGFNVTGHAKVPPFRQSLEARDYARLAELGVNVIRLLWIWEAFEPTQGIYERHYLDDVRDQVARAREAGIAVIVDIHQDGFSRFVLGGCGDGFPRWAVPEWVKPATPTNADKCQGWGVRMAFDVAMHRAWHAFYANHNGVRQHYLEMLASLASTLKEEPNVIGYDLLNEPWGTPAELKNLWEDGTRAIRSHDPEALIFISPHALTSTGLGIPQSHPDITQAVYSPHYYDPLVASGRHYLQQGLGTTLARLKSEAHAWGMPLFIGEFGFSPMIGRAAAFRRDIYAALDQTFTGAAQWNYTPQWTPDLKDGWNLEDFSIVDQTGALRANFVPRPYPQATAGTPGALTVDTEAPPGAPWLSYEWVNAPDKGSTEIFVGRTVNISVTVSPEMQCVRKGLTLSCSSARQGLFRVILRRNE